MELDGCALPRPVEVLSLVWRTQRGVKIGIV
jgi:hypothetical protein